MTYLTDTGEKDPLLLHVALQPPNPLTTLYYWEEEDQCQLQEGLLQASPI